MVWRLVTALCGWSLSEGTTRNQNFLVSTEWTKPEAEPTGVKAFLPSPFEKSLARAQLWPKVNSTFGNKNEVILHYSSTVMLCLQHLSKNVAISSRNRLTLADRGKSCEVLCAQHKQLQLFCCKTGNTSGNKEGICTTQDCSLQPAIKWLADWGPGI